MMMLNIRKQTDVALAALVFFWDSWADRQSSLFTWPGQGDGGGIKKKKAGMRRTTEDVSTPVERGTETIKQHLLYTPTTNKQPVLMFSTQDVVTQKDVEDGWVQNKCQSVLVPVKDEPNLTITMCCMCITIYFPLNTDSHPHNLLICIHRAPLPALPPL